MTHPWLRIPASDYEAHMALPEVAQAQALNGLMASALRDYRPESLAVVGCTTGNGFEHIDPARTRRAVGIDINSDYLEILESRFADKIPGLELVEADIADPAFRIEPVAMIFAGLVFEYVDVSRALENMARCMVHGGILVAVLQEPSDESAPVTETPYKSLELLAPVMKLVPSEAFSKACGRVGLGLARADTVPLKKGKSFFVGTYQKGD